MRLDEAVAMYLLNTANLRTRETYGYSINPMVEFIGPARDLEQVTPYLVGEYVETIRLSDRAVATKAKHIKAIKVFFNWLVRHDFIDKSPARVVKTLKIPDSDTREKAMKDDTLDAILNYAKWDARKLALLLFLSDTGCRAGGASDLQVVDINLMGKTAFVTEKGEKRRKVWFGEQCKVALIDWLSRRSGRNGDYVFSRDGQKIQPRSISQIVLRCCLAAGVDPRRSHSIRHRKGHQLADSRVAPTIAQTILGHGDVLTTMKFYYPHDHGSAQEVAEELSAKKQDDNEQQDSKIIYFPVRKRS